MGCLCLIMLDRPIRINGEQQRAYFGVVGSTNQINFERQLKSL